MNDCGVSYDSDIRSCEKLNRNGPRNEVQNSENPTAERNFMPSSIVHNALT